MRRRLFNLFVWILMMGLITGCWDRREVEDRVSVFALGIDSHPAGVEISVQVPVPIMIVGSGGGGEGEGGQGSVHNFSATGKTITEALENLQNQSSHDLFFGHTRLIFLGEQVIREKEVEILDVLRRHPEIRRGLWPLVVTGRARDALGINVRLAQIPTEYILDFMENGANEERMASTSLNRWFINQSDPTRFAYINYLHVQPGTNTGGQGKAGAAGGQGKQGKSESGKVLWKGVAVMSRKRMLGSLSREETNPILQIVEKKSGYFVQVSCPDKKGMIVFQPKSVDPSISVSHRGKQVNIRVNVEVEGGINESTCPINLSEKKALEKVEKWIARSYEKQAHKTLHRLQKEFRTDVFQFGSTIHAYYPELWKRIDWQRDFSKAHIEFHYRVTVKNLGLESR